MRTAQTALHPPHWTCVKAVCPADVTAGTINMRKHKGKIEAQPEDENFDYAIASDTGRELPTELTKETASIRSSLGMRRA